MITIQKQDLTLLKMLQLLIFQAINWSFMIHFWNYINIIIKWKKILSYLLLPYKWYKSLYKYNALTFEKKNILVIINTTYQSKKRGEVVHMTKYFRNNWQQLRIIVFIHSVWGHMLDHITKYSVYFSFLKNKYEVFLKHKSNYLHLLHKKSWSNETIKNDSS